MKELLTLTGGCQCGAIRYEIDPAHLSISPYFLRLENPPVSMHLDLSYRVINWQSKPKAIFEIQSQQEISNAMIIIKGCKQNERLLTIPLKSGLNLVSFEFESPEDIANTYDLTISIDGMLYDFKSITSKLNSRLHGRITDWENNPLPGAWITVFHESCFQIAQSDANGCYEMSLPSGTYDCIAPFTRNYPTSELEDYYWNLDLTRDREVHFKIGNLEIFRLTASSMKQNNIIAGTFICWSSPVIKNFIESEKPKDMSHPGFISKENTPEIDQTMAEFYLNQVKLNGPSHLQRCDILFPNGKVAAGLGYKFEVIYNNSKAPIYDTDNILEVRILTKNKERGRARIGGLQGL